MADVVLLANRDGVQALRGNTVQPKEEDQSGPFKFVFLGVILSIEAAPPFRLLCERMAFSLTLTTLSFRVVPNVRERA